MTELREEAFFFGELTTLEFVICRIIRGKHRPVVIKCRLLSQPSVGLKESGSKGTAGFCSSQNEAGKQSCTVRPTRNETEDSVVFAGDKQHTARVYIKNKPHCQDKGDKALSF